METQSWLLLAESLPRSCQSGHASLERHYRQEVATSIWNVEVKARHEFVWVCAHQLQDKAIVEFRVPHGNNGADVLKVPVLGAPP
eukprot:2146520-Amphidinium_carterae.1